MVKRQAADTSIELTTAIDSYLLSVEAAGRALSTRYVYRLVLGLFHDFVQEGTGGLVPIRLATALTADQLRAFIRYLRATDGLHLNADTAPRSDKTVRQYAVAVKTFARWCVLEEGLLAMDPLTNVRAPRATERVVAPFSPEQLRKLLRAAQQRSTRVRDQAMLLFLLSTGVRVTELCSLQLADVHLAQKRAKVLGKGSKERWVLFDATTGRALARYFAQRGPTTAKEAFLGRTGTALTRSAVCTLIVRMGEAAGISDEVRCSPHTFRHTFATEFLKAHPGALFHLQERLGHTTLGMTRRYAKMAESDAELEGPSIVERLGLNRLVR